MTDSFKKWWPIRGIGQFKINTFSRLSRYSIFLDCASHRLLASWYQDHLGRYSKWKDSFFKTNMYIVELILTFSKMQSMIPENFIHLQQRKSLIKVKWVKRVTSWSFSFVGSWKARFLLKNQLYSNDIAVFCTLTQCQNHTFEVNFLCQKSTDFFQKKNHLRISI